MSDHPKCTQKTWSLTGGGRVQESNHMGPLPRRGPGTSTSWKIIYCMQFLSYAMCSSMFNGHSKFFLTFKVAQRTQWTLRSENASSGRLQEVKNNRKSSTIRPQKWWRSLTGGGRLLEVPTVRLWRGKLWFLLGGRMWEMVALEVRLYHYHYFLISYAISDF